MSYWKCLFGVIAISLAYSAEIGPGYTIIEVFDTQVYKDYQIEETGDKVDVQLYYECLCPACIDFYTKTFNKTVTKLAAYLNITTYPYGNAERNEVNGTTVIECQHGPLECYGNKLHACAIDILNDTTKSIFYNSCMMTGREHGRGRSTDQDATRCGESMGIDANPIIECAKSQKGEELLEYYGKETQKNAPDKAGVPWPLINGKVYLGEDKYFIRTICAYLASPPPACKQL